MFVRILAVHCDQNIRYEITRNVYQARIMKTNKRRNFRSPAMGNLPQYEGRSWDVHQFEYLIRSENFGENLD